MLEGRKREYGIDGDRGINVVSLDLLPLRGFLKCTKCPRILTGSASRGRNGYHHYYHCQSSCGFRYNASVVNMAFVRHLKKFVPRPGMTELFYEAICDIYKNNDKIKGNEKSLTLSKISEHNGRITKARELLLSDAIDPNDYKKIKLEAEEQITRLEAKPEELKSKNSQNMILKKLPTEPLKTLKNLIYCI